MVKKKRASKRQTLSMKYKIEKKVNEHHRKQRRQQRKDAREGKVVMKRKEPGLPNLMPYKEKFLRQVLADKEREEEHERERIRNLHKRRAAEGEDEEEDEEMEDAELDDSAEAKKRQRIGGDLSKEALASARARSADFEAKEQAKLEEEAEDQGLTEADAGTRMGKKRHYMKELRNVVDQADVILLVVDARDPMGCRAPQAERMVMDDAKNKRLVIVLNKIDLVPKKVADAWLTELRKEFPTIAFRASQQDQKNNLGRAAKDSVGAGAASSSNGNAAVGDGVCVGADTLMQLLKNYSRNRGIKTSITVGVVGYPNVGKSSVINSLKRQRCVGVSATAGFTKTLQIVQLDKKVRLIDSPGVLFQDSARDDKLVLRNCVNPGDLADPIKPVEQLVDLCRKETLMELYSLPRFSTTTEFLVALGAKRGKLTKGGVPNKEMAARLVLQDFHAGKIPYYVQPPKQSVQPSSLHAKVVSEWAKEFDIDALMAKEQSELVEKLPDDMDDDDVAAIFSAAMPSTLS